MTKERFVVIGAVAAGMSASSRARRLKPDMEITVLERTGDVSWAACGMPYLIADRVKSANNLVRYDVQFFKEKRDIDLFLYHEVKQIFPQQKTVLVKNIKTGEEKEYIYDKLLIATGARPVVPPIKGVDLKGVFTLRQLQEGIAIKEYIRKNSPQKGLIIGAGYVGMEMAESFSAAGMKVTIVEKMPNIIGTMDDEITEVVEEELKDNGVTIIKSSAVVEFRGNGSSVTTAVTDTGMSIDTDIVLIGVGIKPNSEIARDAGIALGQTGAINVNAKMETNIPDIYAAGDCAEAYHLVLGRNVYIPLGTTANKQGRIAGENAAGGNASFAGIVGTAVFKTFNLEVGRTGITEKEAKLEGVDYVSNIIQDSSRAFYYPGRSNINVKLVAGRKTGLLLGAQMVGREGIAKRVDVFATAITAKMTVGEIGNLDLGYAPPFAPVYDPILIAADELQKKLKDKKW
jgi:NADPH-dependent 2,4-dienoyl-CoA reductase/sulfur reductase-like enzyme